MSPKTDVLRGVEPVLVPCLVGYQIIFEMVPELLSVQKSGKEQLEGDLAWSLRVVRKAVAKPPLRKTLGPRR